jgi:hypothetical protein
MSRVLIVDANKDAADALGVVKPTDPDEIRDALDGGPPRRAISSGRPT